MYGNILHVFNNLLNSELQIDFHQQSIIVIPTSDASIYMKIQRIKCVKG